MSAKVDHLNQFLCSDGRYVYLCFTNFHCKFLMRATCGTAIEVYCHSFVLRHVLLHYLREYLRVNASRL